MNPVKSRDNYCSQCGLMYRLWIHKVERKVCDECEPEKFKELYNENISIVKKRTRGQKHITEHHYFPDAPKKTQRKDRYIRDIC